ncbi:MAG: C45 family autoproteolytic acyltransferase/hydrolase [Janthinobacterium lividum]
MSVRTFRSSVLSPYERGLEFGRRYPEEIAACVASYRRLFDRAAGGSVDLDVVGGQARQQIEACAPNLAAEIEGFATGAGLPPTHLAAINARTEVLAWAHRQGGTPPPHECSAVVKLTVDGTPPVAVQAWDWYADLADSWLVWEIPHADGRLTTTLTEYGIVGKIGVSSAHLGVLVNILHHADDGLGIGAPVHVLARKVLDDAADVNQALLVLTAAPVAASTALTLVAGSSEANTAVSVELNPVRAGFALPDDLGLLIHTNHFLSSPASSADTELQTGPDTLLRYDLLRRRLHAQTSLSVSDVVAAMDTHLVGGGSLCCHPDPALAPDAQFQTLATIALDVEAGRMDVTQGGACTHPLLHPAPHTHANDSTPTDPTAPTDPGVLAWSR